MELLRWLPGERRTLRHFRISASWMPNPVLVWQKMTLFPIAHSRILVIDHYGRTKYRSSNPKKQRDRSSPFANVQDS